jgi:hypothetical protein
VHSDRGAGHPAINVKVREHLYNHVATIAERFKCSEHQAEQALNFAFEMATRDFWEQAEELVKEIFPDAQMYSEGRSGGWLAVHGLPDVESWDAIMLARWGKLEKAIKATMKYLCSAKYLLDAIESNKWYLEGAEEYNYKELKDGTSICIAELKQKAIKAGFGLVVR